MKNKARPYPEISTCPVLDDARVRVTKETWIPRVLVPTTRIKIAHELWITLGIWVFCVQIAQSWAATKAAARQNREQVRKAQYPVTEYQKSPVCIPAIESMHCRARYHGLAMIAAMHKKHQNRHPTSLFSSNLCSKSGSSNQRSLKNSY